MGVPYYRSRRHTAAAASGVVPTPAALIDTPPPDAVPLAYPVEVVPAKAADVVAWIGAGVDEADTLARAAVALEVELARGEHRSTVLAACNAASDP